MGIRNVLITFMELKQEWLREQNPKAFKKNENEYFNALDAGTIGGWSKELCKKIIDKMIDDGSHFGHYTCPFCIANNVADEKGEINPYCSCCKYAKTHLDCRAKGFLGFRKSSFLKIHTKEISNKITNKLVRKWVFEAFLNDAR